ncbi:hypothetical protein CANTEDRAFT_113152 [Yamadazyma tenuis ATCC 10573]|uniref:Uncharacterized protein n=1 Tax=Candida tenuis (strain ATCC 10573 / BCRC 21748 / CBS 615 / JCM 9827 / NBRC 10315 / NRRL Y-1498 / VKM Y-70) TaxID=590646 RepID=G3B0J0_CANTC|nr:uncharacterized protein CANTEDRAFT_113152 [Yamadazyma tenuis ATCC 10573]XP_006685231.1 uncharacterized protein CANTEDRAFT_113152 [Yamadazyma tenuis ATCC 10573]EGV65544.1 hypothetical protein CANTEDRAFT_113152 [Yamadazyma tenuis ATCC 10573]EGV65545.1 hypothetical protein CANTEDRAFT_113152 [Yamadazyma tenuis ATCC 10573]
MCKAAICSICHNKSWIGCGLHIPGVMDHTPKTSWCTCDHSDESSDLSYPPKAGTGFAKKTTID